MGRRTSILAPMRVHGTHDNDLSYDDCATSVTGTQSLLEQMYQIIHEKIPVEEPFFWRDAPIIRDTLTGRR
jgi:hypothetical protein